MNFTKNYISKIILACATTVLLLSACAQTKKITAVKKPMPVIFETDMGNDVDDALALDMLYKYMDSGLIKLIAISTNKNSKYSA